MSDCRYYTISEAVDKYLITKGVSKKKYFKQYLIVGTDALSAVCREIIQPVKSLWQPIKYDKPYFYINVPKDCDHVISVNDVNDCGNLVSLFHNRQMNVVPKPDKKVCSCLKCDCDGLCAEFASPVITTKLLFESEGVPYYEKQWIQLCKNGDVLEYTETPVKKYNDRVGESLSDFNDDYNNDFNSGTGEGFANFSIETVSTQRKIVALTVKECGCPDITAENVALIKEYCGCVYDSCHWLKRLGEHQFFKDINHEGRAEINMSECGTRIYIKGKYSVGDYLNIIYDTNGRDIDTQSMIAEDSLMAVWAEIDNRIKMFNGRYSLGERDHARAAAERAKTNLMMERNPIPDFQTLSDLSNGEIKW